MKYFITAVFALLAFLPLSVAAQDSPISQLPWEFGPTTGSMGNVASIRVPKGFAFLGVDGTRKLNVIMENPPTQGELYTLAPEDLSWVAFFSFNNTESPRLL